MDFTGKKITVMGLGLHGGGTTVAWWLATQGARVLVTDLKSSSELQPSIDTLEQRYRAYRRQHSDATFFDIEYVLGTHREQDFCEADLVVQNPAVPRESRFLALAREHGVSIENEASLFFLATPDCFKIGVTGTRGKSTTATLLHAMIARGIPDAQLTGVALPSGSRGACDALPAILEKVRRGVHVPIVMELSSWQLECLVPHRMSPSLSILTNIFPDHLNRYGSMEEYSEAKKTIYRYQDECQACIFNFDNDASRACAQEKSPRGRYFFSRLGDHGYQGTFCASSRITAGVQALWMRDRTGALTEFAAVTDTPLKGDHNLENILAASAAAFVVGMAPEQIRQAIRSFHGIDSRLQHIAAIRGRDFYNDTASTSPQATIAALRTLSPLGTRIILIAGGSDKGLDFTPLAHVAHTISHLIFFEGSAAAPFSAALAKAYRGPLEYATDMESAVRSAWQASREGDIILLSPASASFGLFINEFDRGKQFEREIDLLRNAS